MARSVVAADGRRWVVRRRLAPRLGTESLWGRFHRRFRQTMRRAGDAADADPGCLDVIGEGIVAAIAIVLAVLVALFVLLPLLVAVVDVVVVVALSLLGILARVVLRRPWTVEARAGDGSSLLWRVVGWRASGDQVDAVAEGLRAGVVPPGAVSPPP